jgi:lantibiotic transport system permease protein
MIFYRALKAEILKLRRTFALKMVVLSPAAIVVLMLFITSQSPFTILRRVGSGSDWIALANVTLLLWGLLMLPLFITLEATLIAGVDHGENQWKALFARPINRANLYLAKLTVVTALTIVSTLILLAGLFAGGVVLPHLQTEAKFASPIPAATIIREGLEMTGLGFLALTIQHWVSLRWRSFAVSMGVGIVGMVIGYGMVVASQPNGGWALYFPWSLPMLILAMRPVNVTMALCGSTLLGCLVTIVGCNEFCRREVH